MKLIKNPPYHYKYKVGDIIWLSDKDYDNLIGSKIYMITRIDKKESDWRLYTFPDNPYGMAGIWGCKTLIKCVWVS